MFTASPDISSWHHVLCCVEPVKQCVAYTFYIDKGDKHNKKLKIDFGFRQDNRYMIMYMSATRLTVSGYARQVYCKNGVSSRQLCLQEGTSLHMHQNATKQLKDANRYT